jgi:hypothetical protein
MMPPTVSPEQRRAAKRQMIEQSEQPLTTVTYNYIEAD